VRHVARAPREGINVSHEHPLTEATTLTLGLAGALILAAALLVFFVDIVVSFISPKTEAELFADWDFSRVVAAELRVAPELQALADRLQRHWPDSPYRFTLAISDVERTNALALPGGTILVTRGLLESVESENELAFVLGHEIGHFKNRDHLRQLGRGFAFGLVLLAMAGNDGGFVSASILDSAARSFGRQQESAADRVALEIVQAEYGHVAEAWAFLERQVQRDSAFANVAAYFATHPASAARIDELRSLAAVNGWSTAGEVTSVGRLVQRAPIAD
jgi:Zn-dependent protease with chaperone function